MNVLKLADGMMIIYDEYELKHKLSVENREIAITREGLEHLIKVSFTEREGVLFTLLHETVSVSIEECFTLANTLLLRNGNKHFARWDKKRKIWRSSSLSRRVWTLEKCPLDVKTLDTKDRPSTAKEQLKIEIENQKIFNQQCPIMVIDDESRPENLKIYKQEINKLKKKVGSDLLIFIEGAEKKRIIGMCSQAFTKKYQNALEAQVDSVMAKIMNKIRRDRLNGKQYQIVQKGKVNPNEFERYLRDNPFYHISGIRNFTILACFSLGKKVIMNFDDDAPPETYTLLPADRRKLLQVRLKAKEKLVNHMILEAETIIGLPLKNEYELYRIWAEYKDQLADLQKKYFGYSTDGTKGLIPQAMANIVSMYGTRPCKFTKEGLKISNQASQAMDVNTQLTHQRYQGLMFPLADANIAVADFVYPEPRVEKKDERFMVIPVNVIRGAELVGRKAKDTHFMYMQKDLRGTLGVPADAEESNILAGKTITYVPYPFILDQDTSGLAQFIRYLTMPQKRIADLQHTNRTALIAGNVRGFIGDSYVIFNRCAFDVSFPTPSIGQTLRLEEPPYIKWIKQPLSGNQVTVCFSPVAGGQQRVIGDRFYVIPFQDFNELVGTIGREFYEQAVERYYNDLNKNPELLHAGRKELFHLLGTNYMQIGEHARFNNNHKQILIQERQYRALLLSRLALQRAAIGTKLAEVKSSKEREQLQREINDMDLIMVRYAEQFHFYKAKNIPDKERTNKEDNYSPLDVEKDYFYKVSRKGKTMIWEKITPIIHLGNREDVSDPVAIISKWISISQPHSISIKGWHEGDVLVLEKGRKIILEKLPSEGQEIILSCLVEEYESAYLQEIEDLLFAQITQDGETIYLWPDLMEIGKRVFNQTYV
ncbi:MAG: hypothetical protein MUO85_00770 [candidate division Zixibacteria bacterium]|nr:hypothetical protein [candidate division Zixibacteria bacterium]